MSVDKLVDSTQLDADLTSVANAIRTKGGTSAQLAFPADFVQAIEDIETGGGIQEPYKVASGKIIVASNTQKVVLPVQASEFSKIVYCGIAAEGLADSMSLYSAYKRVIVRGHRYNMQNLVPYGSSVTNIVEINANGSFENWNQGTVGTTTAGYIQFSWSQSGVYAKPEVPLLWFVWGLQ